MNIRVMVLILIDAVYFGRYVSTFPRFFYLFSDKLTL